METKYNHTAVEQGRYQKWLDEKLFQAHPQSKQPKFCIVLPPPNVTGQLHLGHAWDGTIQDVLIRYKKLQGFDTLFIPGTDHAGIATQVKVLERIKRETGLELKDLDKTQFLAYAWKWKTEYHKIIHQQWAQLGLALDYNHEKFTLDRDVNQAVNQVFVQLYEQGLIYQGTKIVNWDPQLKTAISNIEVNYQEVNAKLYYFKYYLPDKSNYLSVATTRPETMFADQAVLVNSQDHRYQKYLNQMVINPVNQQLIKVIADDYVDMTFGSGAMKCTPAHDFNDYELGVKHHLAMPLCLNPDGTMNELAGKYQGQDRLLCRKNLIADLTKAQLVDKIVDHTHQVGYSERTNVVVEPYLSQQWFIKMQDVAQLIIKKQKHDQAKVQFYPVLFEEQLLKWVRNMQDWCISRQLWWGHQIPVWHHKTTKAIYVGVKPPKNAHDYEQDHDVLDTWFSSALWPLVTLNWPHTNDLLFKSYYPTSVLVTAYDILFFWVVRMIFMGEQLTSQRPFHHVLIHGLIRDEQGRKMSKSLNNGINPLDVIKQYGTDALRYFLISNCAPGQDLRFSTIKIEAAWNLINKLWNAARYVLLNLPNDFKLVSDITKLALAPIDQWILNQCNNLITKVAHNMDKYEFIIVSHDLANFIWNDYCAWYIELSKFNLQDKSCQAATTQTLVYILQQITIMLHPFIPFVTEHLYQKINPHQSVLQAKYPRVVNLPDAPAAQAFVTTLTDMITKIREVRKELNIPFKTKVELHINTQAAIFKDNSLNFNNYLLSIVHSEVISISNETIPDQKVTKIINNAILEIKTNNLINYKQELAKLEAEKMRITNELARSEKILNNDQFLKKASSEKVQQEKEKYEVYQKQLTFIEKKLKELM